MAALFLVLACVAPALSAQGVNPASVPAPAPGAISTRATPVPPASPATAGPSSKAESAPAGKDEATEDKPAKPAEKLLPHIALILPLGSKTFDKVADAVKQGFLAGARADGKNAAPFRVYTADDDTGSLATQYRKAALDGAMAIVGGVTRDGANIMARESSYVASLALNAPASDSDLPERFFYVSLNLDWEARLAARTAASDGFRRAAVVTAATPLARRVQDSFEKEWIRLGGELAVRLTVSGDLSEGTRVTAAMEKADADVTFLATEMKVARVVRPYLPAGMQVFATSMTIDPRADTVENLDLESVRFMEMPWFVQPDHPAVMAYARPAEPMPIDYERLYALGIDAWRLAQLVTRADKPKSFPSLDGVTGRITLEGHQFVRMLASGEMRDGRPVLFKPVD
jgi:hypothetical protein